MRSGNRPTEQRFPDVERWRAEQLLQSRRLRLRNRDGVQGHKLHIDRTSLGSVFLVPRVSLPLRHMFDHIQGFPGILGR